MWRSEDLWELVPSFYHVGPRDGMNPAIRSGEEYLYPLSNLISLTKYLFACFDFT